MTSRRRQPGRPGRRILATAGAVGAALALSACGNAMQTKPIPHNELEGMVISPYPVYWLGDRFGDLTITEAAKDVSGAFMVQYGTCLQGGEGNCTPPLRVVTSPDNSFVPGGTTPAVVRTLRGASATFADGGRTIAIPTGEVVLSIIADTPALAKAAADTAVPINRPLSPGQPLPPRLPNTGFGSKPLGVQLPSTVRPLR